MEDEIEGIKELILDYAKRRKTATIKELSDFLFLNENVIWAAVDGLQDDGTVILTDKTTIKPVEKL